jgi:hypothetical protein
MTKNEMRNLNSLEDIEFAVKHIDKLEAQLEKAMAALKRIASGEFEGVLLTSLPPQDAATAFARTALSELKEKINE